jgi:hypothetical protein
MRIDDRALDPRGSDCWMSLVLAPPEVSLLFDDHAVVGATRAALAMPPADACSTLIVETFKFGGAATVVHAGNTIRLDDDPFARVHHARRLQVDAGFFGRMLPPTGAGTQRYGSGRPWPWDRFADALETPHA